MIGNRATCACTRTLYLMDQFSSQIRVFRPADVNRTEVTIYCIAPKGESAEARARRIRQYEDFFNASAWPRRTTSKNSAPARKASWAALEWNDSVAGATHWVEGPGRRSGQDRPQAHPSRA